MGERNNGVERVASAVRSPVSWATLGLVIQRPSYGYELVQRFERTYSEVLELSSPSQVYTALDSLARRAMIEEVTPVTPEAPGRQPKPHYGVTPEGLRHYEEQLIGQLMDEGRRSRLFALQLALLSPEVALGLIERYEHTYLKQAGAKPGRLAEGAVPDGVGGLVERLAGEEDRLKLEARLRWIDFARRELTALASARALAR